jgi:hypothetical protein
MVMISPKVRHQIVFKKNLIHMPFTMHNAWIDVGSIIVQEHTEMPV